MNKAEEFFRSMFADEAEYLRFRLANRVIVDEFDLVDKETGKEHKVPFIRVVSKDDKDHHVVADDKPSSVQYDLDMDMVTMSWVVDKAHFTRSNKRPVQISISFGDVVHFSYEGIYHDDEVDWCDVFPELCSIDEEDGSTLVDTDIKDWSFLDRVRTTESSQSV